MKINKKIKPINFEHNPQPLQPKIKIKSITPQISFSIFSILLIVLFGFIGLRFENVLMIPTIKPVKWHQHRHGRQRWRCLGIGARRLNLNAAVVVVFVGFTIGWECEGRGRRVLGLGLLGVGNGSEETSLDLGLGWECCENFWVSFDGV